VPPNTYYRLAASDISVRAGGPLPGTVDVPSFRADGMLNNRAILHREGPSAVSGYNYHFWWQAPGVMLQQSLVDALRQASAFQLVATPELHLDRSYEIIGQLRKFEQNGAGVSVEVELMLRNVRSGKPLLLKTYQQQVAASDGTVPAAVSAFSTAVSRIWADFVSDLGAVTPPPAS
jgi:ABC-type uncharacterized transport system auxiliary subunit